MNKRGLVTGFKSAIKQERARELRRDMSPAEKRLWQCLRRNRCSGLHFRRQQVIDGFIADFYCHAAGLIIELDGGIHQQQADYDIMRDRIIAARDLYVLRLQNERVIDDLPAVLAEIEVVAQERIAQLKLIPGATLYNDRMEQR